MKKTFLIISALALAVVIGISGSSIKSAEDPGGGPGSAPLSLAGVYTTQGDPGGGPGS